MNNRVLNIVTYSLAACIFFDSVILSCKITALKKYEKLSVRPSAYLGMMTFNFNDDNRKKGLLTININDDINGTKIKIRPITTYYKM